VNPFIFVGILLLFISTYFLIGIFAARNVRNTLDYFLAGRQAGLWGITATLIGTQLGSGLLLGTAEKSYEYGFFGIGYTLSIAIGFLLLSSGIAAQLQTLNIKTTAELFLVRYHSPLLHKCASLFSIITLSGILMGQMVASKALLAGILAGSTIPLLLLFIIVWSSIIIYTFAGGLNAVIRADTFRVVFIIVIYGILFLYLLWSQPSAWFTTQALTTQKTLFTLDTAGINNFVGILIMPALFSLIEQDLAQRFFAARTAKIAAAAAVLAGLFMLLFAAVPVFLGMLAKVAAIDIGATNPLIATLRYYSNDVFFSLGVCGVIAAIASTSDSLLCAISSNIAQDFEFSFFNTSKLRTAQLVSALVGISAASIAYVIHTDIIDILIDSYEISVSALLVPLLFSYFDRTPKKTAAYFAVAGGLISFLLFKLYPAPYASIITLVISLIGYLAGAQKHTCSL
jgi:SSS family solute:Na+ symporter